MSVDGTKRASEMPSPMSLVGLKRTSLMRALRSANDPKRTFLPAGSAPSSSSPLWSLLRAYGVSGSSHRRVQGHGGANERLQRLFINLVALMEIDGTPGVAFEAGV